MRKNEGLKKKVASDLKLILDANAEDMFGKKYKDLSTISRLAILKRVESLVE